MLLRETYTRRDIHESWESVYRGNPVLDRFNMALHQRIARYFPPPAPAVRLLDAGCGVGYHTLAFARRGYQCVGIDISPTILDQAQSHCERTGMTERVTFACQPLEDLSFPDASFDIVHCRGVLMHVPEWERALRQLCRVLKPGGCIVIMENCTTALETWLARLVRSLRGARSTVRYTPAGVEFWTQKEGVPMLTRIARIDALVRCMAECKVKLVTRFAGEFWDPNRFPAGGCRNAAIQFNRLALLCRFPAWLSMGNVLIGRK
ncbi:MAG: class I SAM-dependent methyltransferase [Gemmataceae bacterium]|nr:class I SAM-dependent methyltransferase [Gemmataceae bacterium]